MHHTVPTSRAVGVENSRPTTPCAALNGRNLRVHPSDAAEAASWSKSPELDDQAHGPAASASSSERPYYYVQSAARSSSNVDRHRPSTVRHQPSTMHYRHLPLSIMFDRKIPLCPNYINAAAESALRRPSLQLRHASLMTLNSSSYLYLCVRYVCIIVYK